MTEISLFGWQIGFGFSAFRSPKTKLIMIRFLNLKDQICEGENHFAFFDTISDTILTFGNEQVFSSLDEFEEAYKESYSDTRPLTRFISLIPDDFFGVS